MGNFFQNLQPYIQYIVVLDTFLVLILLILLFSLSSKVKETNRLLRWLSEGERLQDVKLLLLRQQTFMQEVDENFASLKRELKELLEKHKETIQKVGFIRFDAFKDTGGELSFSLALLNGKNEGVVISSLHGREGSRVYGKTIKNGSSLFPLSDEEKEAIRRALSGGE